MSSEIKVSVCVVTYNQEDYIAECLQSLVDQETDFGFEIIVGEDCSTDSTRKIVQEFQEKYPHIIKPIFHKKNIGAVENVLAVYRAAKGKYIAHVDGDDLALPGKLQIQCEILANNPDCTICSHDVDLIKSTGERIGRSFKQYKAGISTLLDLYETLPFFAHSSKMFVNDLNAGYWNELHPEALDIEIHVEQAKKGHIYHLTHNLGCYRVFTGVTTSTKKVNSLLPNGTDRIFEKALQENFFEREIIERFYAKAFFNYAYQSAMFGDTKGLKKYIKKSMDIAVVSKSQILFFKLSMFPRMVMWICQTRDVFNYYRLKISRR